MALSVMLNNEINLIKFVYRPYIEIFFKLWATYHKTKMKNLIFRKLAPKDPNKTYFSSFSKHFSSGIFGKNK